MDDSRIERKGWWGESWRKLLGTYAMSKKRLSSPRLSKGRSQTSNQEVTPVPQKFKRPLAGPVLWPERRAEVPHPTREEHESLAMAITNTAKLSGKRADLLDRVLAMSPHRVPLNEAQAKLGKTLREARAIGRAKVAEYANSEEGQSQRWRPVWKPKVDQVIFEPNTSPTRAFWWDHLKSRKAIAVVCTELLFFLDGQKDYVFRHLDVNPPRALSNRAKIAELRKKDGKASTSGLTPVYLYLWAGDVLASEVLLPWLTQQWEVRRPETPIAIERWMMRYKSKHSIDEVSPIYLGTPPTNEHLRSLFESSQVPDFAYRFGAVGVNHFDIREITEDEHRDLQSRRADMKKSGKITRLRMHNHDGFSYGVVQRLHGIDGVPVTIITSTSAIATWKIAEALVSNDQLGTVFKALDHDVQVPLPRAFEWLFAVEVDSDKYEGKKAQLVGRGRVPPPSSGTTGDAHQ